MIPCVPHAVEFPFPVAAAFARERSGPPALGDACRWFMRPARAANSILKQKVALLFHHLAPGWPDVTIWGMLGSNVLLFPDFGDDFLHSVKTNALYAKQMTSPLVILTLEEERLIAEGIVTARGLPQASNDQIARALSYLEFVIRAQTTVRLLVAENVLHAPSISGLRSGLLKLRESLPVGRKQSYDVETENVLAKFKTADLVLSDIIRRAHKEMHPSVLDFMAGLVASFADAPATVDDFEAGKYPMEMMFSTLGHRSSSLLDGQIVPLFGMMLALAALHFEAGGTPVVWNQASLRDAVWAVHRIISGADGQVPPPIDAEGILGTTIVKSYLPAVYDLPIEEILAFRSKYEGDLDAFRSAVSELAINIDVTKSGPDIQRQAKDIVRSKVNPAVRDLNSKLKIARLDALQKIGKSWQSLASLTFSSTIAVLAGAHLDTIALAGLAGTVGQALLDSAIEKRKIMHSSQWTALVRFENLG